MANELQVQLPKQLRDQIAAAQAYREGASPPEGGEVQQEGSPTAEGVGTPNAHVPEATSSPANDDDQTWEQRYRSLQGRLDQERRDKQAIIDRMNDLETLVETMRANGSAATNPTVEAPRYQKLLTPEEEADYGEEMLNVVGKRAREEIAPEVETLKQEIERLKGRVDGVGNIIGKSEQQKMYDGLSTQVPAWRQINVDQGFKDWLLLSDPYSGRKRHDMLMEAFTRHDTGRVVQFFKGFAEVTGTPLGTTSPGNAAPPLNNASGRPSLESFAAPGRARSGQDIVSPDKPVYTSAQIARFYADRRTGKWKGREADAEAIERDIFQAQHEGRIQ
jgi:hypothetical protein